MKHWVKQAALLVAGIAVLAAPKVVGADEVIKIGVTQPLTGAVAASGNYVVQGAKIAESFLNAAGGLDNVIAT
ncbi:MAG: ABC transporter substrate-binding protein, partial [Alphaproteobacteria bacterium]|nr:ABC transporter substrate-binding protein [Alphaproteobacteria bacterium]